MPLPGTSPHGAQKTSAEGPVEDVWTAVEEGVDGVGGIVLPA